MNRTRAFSLVIAASALIVVTGCGGGGSNQQSAAQPSGQSPPPPPVATTTTPVVRVGTLSPRRFIGIEWNGDLGSVSVDGSPAPSSAVHYGDVVAIHGQETTDYCCTLTDTADATELQHLVNGPVDAVDLAHDRLKVMGQDVLLAGLSCTGLPADGDLLNVVTHLRPGDRVAVNGHATHGGDILATRIEPQQAPAPFLLTGFVQSLDAVHATFRAGTLTVAYGNAQLEAFGANAPAPGDHVAAFGDQAPQAGRLVASRLRRLSETLDGDVGAVVTIEGVVTGSAANGSFEIDGHRVNIDGVGACGDLAGQTLRPNDRIMVSGASLDSEGVITATDANFCLTRIEPGEITLRGPIGAIDRSTSTVNMFGFNIHTNSLTRLTAEGPSGATEIGLADLYVGEVVMLSGLAGTLARSIVASRLVVPEQIDLTTAQITTVAYSLVDPDIAVAGLAIPTHADTTFQLNGPKGNEQSETSTWFFGGDWQGRCFKRLLYGGTVMLTLDRAANGGWFAARVDVWTPQNCPDDGPYPNAPPALCSG